MQRIFTLMCLDDLELQINEVFLTPEARTERLIELAKIDAEENERLDDLLADLAETNDKETACMDFYGDIDVLVYLGESELPEPPQIAPEDVLDLHLAIQVTPTPGSTQSLSEAKQEMAETLTQWFTDPNAPLFENWGGTTKGIAKAEAEGISYNCDNYPGPFLTQITIYNGTKIIEQSQW